MNKREVMKVEKLVRNYKMVYSDRQDEEESKGEHHATNGVGQGTG